MKSRKDGDGARSAPAAGKSREAQAAAADDRLPAAPWRAALRRRVAAWFDRAARDLPWRRTHDPYAVWLSEVMLQQTQVATVVPYFQRFMAAWPTVAALAAADEHDVLRQWEGLGYYRRARQLHRAAQQIVEQHGGVFPADFAAVRRLPGIGRYTAGAILSFAFDQRQPILEANTLRLHSRLLLLRDDPQGAAAQKRLWRFAEEILPRRGAGRMNQALMELGAMLCTPRQPRCAECPAAALCPTRRQGLQQVIPALRRKPATTAVREAALVVWHRRRVLLLRQGEGGRWAGLWDFPRFAIEAEHPPRLQDELRAKCFARTGLTIGSAEPLLILRHGVTRFRITLECFAAELEGGARRPRRTKATGSNGRAAASDEDARWVRPAELSDFALSTTGRKLARWIAEAEQRD